MDKNLIEEARGKKASGKYNCAQAVACTYCHAAGLDEEQAGRITNGFGIGMGNMHGTCGAIIGTGVIVGLCSKDRFEAMKAMKRIMEKFQNRTGATRCGDIKGLFGGPRLRECPDCVADAAEFLESELAAL